MLGAGAFQLVSVSIPDCTAADTRYVPMPYRGRLIGVYAAIEAAIDTNPLLVTAKIGGTGVTGGVITIPTAASAAGTVGSTTPSALNTFDAGDAVELEFNGGPASTGGACVATLIISAQQR